MPRKPHVSTTFLTEMYSVWTLTFLTQESTLHHGEFDWWILGYMPMPYMYRKLEKKFSDFKESCYLEIGKKKKKELCIKGPEAESYKSPSYRL